MNMTQQEHDALRGLRAHIASLADPHHEGLCAVDPVAKAKVRIYLHTWVLPILDVLITEPIDRTHGDKQTLRCCANDMCRADDSEWMAHSGLRESRWMKGGRA